MDLSTSINLTLEVSYRCAQRSHSWMTLTPVILATSVNHHRCSLQIPVKTLPIRTAASSQQPQWGHQEAMSKISVDPQRFIPLTDNLPSPNSKQMQRVPLRQWVFHRVDPYSCVWLTPPCGDWTLMLGTPLPFHSIICNVELSMAKVLAIQNHFLGNL